MQNPKGPQERNIWEACEKTNIAPQTVEGVKWSSPTGQGVKAKACLSKALRLWRWTHGFASEKIKDRIMG